MPSKRRRNRSRSPLRDPPQQQSGHRGYRQRDYYGNNGPGNSRNDRDNGQPQPAHFYDDPPGPPRPNEDNTKTNAKGAPKKDRPKTIPLENRDKCGACTEYHDIRYCPYPNTEDGRTKICPICDTSKHAWFECWYYKRDVMEQWTVCWVNRRCLPTLVHDAPLDEIFYSRVSLARQAPNIDGPSHLESLNSLPGPLSPAFVQKLVPPDREDA